MQTYIYMYVGIRLRREAVPPVSVARVYYARPGMFPTKLTSPRLDALAMQPQSAPLRIESFPSVANSRPVTVTPSTNPCVDIRASGYFPKFRQHVQLENRFCRGARLGKFPFRSHSFRIYRHD